MKRSSELAIVELQSVPFERGQDARAALVLLGIASGPGHCARRRSQRAGPLCPAV